MIKKNNFNILLEEKLYTNDFLEVYQSVVDHANKNQIVMFNQDLAILIGKIGYIINESLVEPKIKDNTTYESLYFLCVKILDDKVLLDFLLACRINSNSNKIKHSTSNIEEVDITEVTRIYNRLIDLLSIKLEFSPLKNCKLILNETKTINFKENEKHEVIGSSKLTFSLDNKFLFEKFEKNLLGKIIIYCTSGSDTEKYNIKYKLNDKTTLLKENVCFTKKDKLPLSFNVDYSLLVNDKLSIELIVEVLEEKEQYQLVETEKKVGLIFKKKVTEDVVTTKFLIVKTYNIPLETFVEIIK